MAAARAGAEEQQALAARVDALARAGWPRPTRRTRSRRRHEKVGAAKKAAAAALAAEGLDAEKAKGLFKELEADIVRNAILDTGLRIDGRDTKTVRPIIAEVGVLPRAHGSALFTRGETQALVRRDARHRPGRADRSTRSRASTARTSCCTTISRPTRWARPGAWASPGRREIGHGKLAWRAIHPLLPEKDKFPYTLRVVSRDHREQRLAPRWRRSAAPRSR